MYTRRLAFALALLGLVLVTACGTQNSASDVPGQAAALVPTVTATATALVPTATATTATTAPTVLPVAAASPTLEPATAPSGPTPGIAEDAACDARISEDTVMFQSVGALAWSSHQVVEGTVVEVLPAKKIKIAGSMLPFMIVTDAMVKVEQRFRGQPADIVRVRMLSGSIGGCAQEFPDMPQLKAGSRVLLFVRQPDAPTGDNAYEFTGGAQGVWDILDNGLVTTRAIHLLPAYQPAPLGSIEAAISAALAAGPPSDDPLVNQFLVPASEAPIAPGIPGTPTAAP